MKTCIVSALPPLHSGVALYTLGLLLGFGKIELPIPLVIVVNTSASNKIKVKGLKILRNWREIVKRNPHYQQNFPVYSDDNSRQKRYRRNNF